MVAGISLALCSTVKTKRLRSVVHNIGHHAISGLSCVHPHLGVVCKGHSSDQGTIDLMSGEVVLPAGAASESEPLLLGSRTLSEKFSEILETEGLDPAEIADAVIVFQFGSDRWPSSCYVRVATLEGVVLEDAVESSGRRATILRPSS